MSGLRTEMRVCPRVHRAESFRRCAHLTLSRAVGPNFALPRSAGRRFADRTLQAAPLLLLR